MCKDPSNSSEPDSGSKADSKFQYQPIGVFDSGVGGLSVLKAIREQLPNESLFYLADSNHAPYGERDVDYILQRSLAIGQYLQEQKVKALVVACNTASTVAIKKLRESLDIPVVGIEPAIKPAASLTRSGVVGVLATSRTLRSPGVQRLCELYAQNVEVVLQPCPGLVERIEKAELAHPDTISLLESFLQPVLNKGADTIVLGCTHYPFVRDAIQSIAGNSVTVIEPGAAVARQLSRRLEAGGLQCQSANSTEAESEVFFSTGEAGDVGICISALWGKPVSVRHVQISSAVMQI